MSKASRIVDLSTKIPVIVLTLVPFVLWEISLPSSQGYQLPTEDSRVIVTWEVAAACEQLSSMLFGWKGCIISRDHSGRVNLSLDSLPPPHPDTWIWEKGFARRLLMGMWVKGVQPVLEGGQSDVRWGLLVTSLLFWIVFFLFFSFSVPSFLALWDLALLTF